MALLRYSLSFHVKDIVLIMCIQGVEIAGYHLQRSLIAENELDEGPWMSTITDEDDEVVDQQDPGFSLILLAVWAN